MESWYAARNLCFKRNCSISTGIRNLGVWSKNDPTGHPESDKKSDSDFQCCQKSDSTQNLRLLTTPAPQPWFNTARYALCFVLSLTIPLAKPILKTCVTLSARLLACVPSNVPRAKGVNGNRMHMEFRFKCATRNLGTHAAAPNLIRNFLLYIVFNSQRSSIMLFWETVWLSPMASLMTTDAGAADVSVSTSSYKTPT